MEQDARFERDVRLSNPVATSDAARRRRILFFNTWSTAHGGSATSLIKLNVSKRIAASLAVVACTVVSAPECPEIID